MPAILPREAWDVCWVKMPAPLDEGKGRVAHVRGLRQLGQARAINAACCCYIRSAKGLENALVIYYVLVLRLAERLGLAANSAPD